MKKTSMALIALLSLAAVEAQAEKITFVPQGNNAVAGAARDGLVVADTEDFAGKSFVDAKAALIGRINSSTGTLNGSIAWYWVSADGKKHDIINDKTFNELYASLRSGYVRDVYAFTGEKVTAPVVR